MLAPWRPLHVTATEQAVWKSLGFPGFVEEDYIQDSLSRGEVHRIMTVGRTVVAGKLRLLMKFEYAGALVCIICGYSGYSLMRV